MKKHSIILVLFVAMVFIIAPQTIAGTKNKASSSKEKIVLNQKTVTKRATIKRTDPKATTTTTNESFGVTSVDPGVSTSSAVSKPATGELIKWQVLSSGGTSGTSTNFGLMGTVAQTAVGVGTSTNFGLNSGFWQDFEGGGGGTCCSNGIAGDADGGGDVNIGDAIFIVKYAFEEGSPTPPCCGQADADGGGDVNIGDAIYIVKFAFEEGAPFPSCSAANPECL